MTVDHDPGREAGGFGSRLRALRRAAGLTQADLAHRAGVGVRTVRDLEHGRSARPQRTTVELLAGALGLVGVDRGEFVDAARGGTAARDAGAPGRAGRDAATSGPAGQHTGAVTFGLPASGVLFGRDHDLAELDAMLSAERPGGATAGDLAGPGGDRGGRQPVESAGRRPTVVSLVGLAGVGKTDLALAVSQRVADRYPGGVTGIVVTESSTESDVLSAVATVFGVNRPADLADRLAVAPALLLIDAIERAPEAVAAALRRIVRTSPGLRVVTTGRHPLGLPEERVWPVAPLEVPPPGTPAELSAVLRYPAVELFLARLRQVRREPPVPEELSALVRLVRRLGGLPLALELAAARGRILDLNEILDRYGDRVLDLAAPATPRASVAVTLRDAVAASYRLLEAPERAALRRLAAFRNRWSVELAEAVLAPGGPVPGMPDPAGRAGASGPGAAGTVSDPVPLLDRLLELGLLSVRGTGVFRFRLLDVVRDFALERAAADGELTAIRHRHASVCAGLAARAAPELAGASLPVAVGRLDEVSSDLWAALAYAANEDPHTALGLAANLARWWRFRGRDVAGRHWLRRLLDDPRTADADPRVRAWARVAVAELAVEHGAGAQELPAVRAALPEFQRAGEVSGELAARAVLAAVFTATGAHEEARRQGEALLALATRAGRVRDMAVAQNNLTWHEIRVGDLRAARGRMAAVDRLAAYCGEERLRALARADLAEVARLEGRSADAVDQGRRALTALAGLGDPGHRRRALGTVGLALVDLDRLDEATAVLTELRCRPAVTGAAGQVRADRWPGPLPDAPEDGICALIEGALALRRGDREWAAEWFGAAARVVGGVRGPRTVVEALIGLATSTDDPAVRATALERLERACRTGGVRLLPRERAAVRSLAPGAVVAARAKAKTKPLARSRSRRNPPEGPLLAEQ